MMELEKQVCSLPLAKRLKELGVKQESYFVWQKIGESEAIVTEEWSAVGFEHPNAEHCSAFTVAEMGEILPREVHHIWNNEAVHSQMTIGKTISGKWWVGYNFLETMYDETESDARAKMLIHLIEQGLVTP